MVSDFVLNYPTVSSLANEDIIIKRYYAKEKNGEVSYSLTPENISEAFLPALT